MDAAEVWREKSDDELRRAAETLHEYTEEGRKIILAELSRRSLKAEVSTAAPEGLDTGGSAVDRYRDAYRVANGVVWIGSAVKVLGFVIGSLFALGGGTQLEGSTRLGVILFGVLVAIAFWIVGVFVSAHGQLLQATLDTAVHSSPFLTNEERASAMSLTIPTLGRRTAV